MYSVAVEDHFMIAHSFTGAVFGPAQNLHGATYDVTVEFRRPALDADGIVVDIGRATEVLRGELARLDFQNLDAVEELAGQNTTTEFLARLLHGRLAVAIGDGRLGPHAAGLASLRVALRESPRAWAAYDSPLD